MNQPIHVLQVLGKLNTGGVETRQMDLLRNLDRSKIQFDFMIHTNEKCVYEEEAESLGAKIYRVPRFKFYNIFSYRKAWKNFFKVHPEIKIVHGHMTSVASIYLPIAKKFGCYTIAHVRNAGVEKGLKGVLTNFLRKDLINKCDQAIGCSKLAAISVYGEEAYNLEKVMIFNNAIIPEKFEYNEEKRNEVRKLYNIAEDTFLIGNIGRLDYQKNHVYMIQILQELIKSDTNVKMMFVGEGYLEEKLKEQIQELGLEQYFIFAGRHSNVQDYYAAFDFFILPSHFEGLPGVAVEAQASGLHGIVSDKVTDECLITDLFTQLSIDEPAFNWARVILENKNTIDKKQRRSYTKEISDAGFDVTKQVKWLEDYYENIVSSK